MKIAFSDWIAETDPDTPAYAPVDPAVIERIREQAMDKIQPKKKLSRRARAFLTAAAVLAALSITAGAVYLASHAGSRELMEAGPLSNGNHPQVIDETSAAILSEAESAVGLQSTDNGSAVTLESIMGFATDQLSVIYLTLNVAYPEGTEFDCSADDLGFVVQHLEFDPDMHVSGGGSSVAIYNDDSTYSIMLMYEFEGDLSGSRATLELTDFANIGEENMRRLFDGTAKAEVPGTWRFTFDLPLDKPDTVAFDPALFDSAAFHPVSISLCGFGGALTLADDSVYLERIALELADGTTYDGVFRSFAAGNDETGEIHYTYGFVFEAPQDLSNAAALLIEGVRVPLE